MSDKPNWKQCPKCTGWIPNPWESHRKCGWNVPTDEKVVQVSTPMFKTADKTTESVKTLFLQAKRIVAEAFEIEEKEMNEKVKSWTGLAQMIDSCFIELCRREKR